MVQYLYQLHHCILYTWNCLYMVFSWYINVLTNIPWYYGCPKHVTFWLTKNNNWIKYSTSIQWLRVLLEQLIYWSWIRLKKVRRTHTPLHTGEASPCWVLCSAFARMMPTAPRAMLDTPSPISSVDRTNKLQMIFRLLHIFARASFLTGAQNASLHVFTDKHTLNPEKSADDINLSDFSQADQCAKALSMVRNRHQFNFTLLLTLFTMLLVLPHVISLSLDRVNAPPTITPEILLQCCSGALPK